MKAHGRIGIFDSGLGGLSVMAAIHQLMPNESLLYYGDSKNAPYGIKTKEAVYDRSKEICDLFIAEGCKAIVIACNTATSAAVTKLREVMPVPIIGMEPAIRPALRMTKGKVLVLATAMTLKEDKFNLLVQDMSAESRILRWPAPDLVTLVENDFDNENLVTEAVSKCFASLKDTEKPDAVVLGCTHFVFLKREIETYFNHEAVVIDGNFGTAQQLKRQLEIKNLCVNDEEVGTLEIRNSFGEAFEKKSKDMLSHLLKEARHHGE
ncbi:glutamate racemase [Fusibacter paucivorans]|uniref:Glutamate racemase n=1 Tax=Fusibacter paucivorans TaxID=76009 RepID=A0ABS5PPQ3_9FIRM|nr:glutamate racemase [Fusibacter paucivorans]